MSKIHEALLQAERDRVAGLGSKQTGDGKGSVWQEATQQAEPPPARAQNATEPGRAPSSPLTSSQPSQSEGLPAATAWSPQLENLPALQARGGPAEQFRSLRSRLAEFRSMHPLKTVLVSSGVPREGKSFIAANLAISLTRNNRVLLIDGDLRKSTLHKTFGTAHEPGLSDYLAGTATVAQILQRGLIQGGRSTPGAPSTVDLTLIAGGSEQEHLEDLAASSRFPALLELLAPSFDWIIVDSSPINLVADAASIAAACDGVLLVVRSGITPFESAQRAQAEFKASPLLGVVLNGSTEPQNVGYYYGSEGTA